MHTSQLDFIDFTKRFIKSCEISCHSSKSAPLSFWKIREEFGNLKFGTLSLLTNAHSGSSWVNKADKPFERYHMFVNILTEDMFDVSEHCHALANLLGQMHP